MYCIINVEYLWPVELQDPVPIDCSILDKKDAPQYFYPNREMAEAELLRLAEKNPGENFRLFKSVAAVMDRGIGKDRVLHIEPENQA